MDSEWNVVVGRKLANNLLLVACHMQRGTFDRLHREMHTLQRVTCGSAGVRMKGRYAVHLDHGGRHRTSYYDETMIHTCRRDRHVITFKRPISLLLTLSFSLKPQLVCQCVAWQVCVCV